MVEVPTGSTGTFPRVGEFMGNAIPEFVYARTVNPLKKWRHLPNILTILCGSTSCIDGSSPNLLIDRLIGGEGPFFAWSGPIMVLKIAGYILTINLLKPNWFFY